MNDRILTLALELLAHPRWEDEDSPVADVGGTQLLPGELPPGLPFDLPVPAGSRIVGSLRQGPEMTVLLDVAREPRAVTAWYREQFSGQGWRAWSVDSMFERTDGEEDIPRPEATLTLCRSAAGPRLFVDARPNGDGTTAVELRIDLQPAAEDCEEPPADVFDADDPWAMSDERLEMMGIPSGSQRRGGGSGWGGGQAYRHVELDSTLEPAAIAAHYREEWLGHGWTLVAEEVNGPVAWSVWTGSNERGERERGTWLAVRLPATPKRYSIEMTIDREPTTRY
jgi:hypothetical protein